MPSFEKLIQLHSCTATVNSFWFGNSNIAASYHENDVIELLANERRPTSNTNVVDKSKVEHSHANFKSSDMKLSQQVTNISLSHA